MNELYKRHYKQDSPSLSVTSSHWKIGGEKNLSLVNGFPNILGMGGFGDVIQASVFQSFKNLPIRTLIKKSEITYVKDKTILRIAKNVCKKSNFIFRNDALKGCLVIQDILKQLPELKNAKDKTICIIGDGYGLLGNFLKSLNPNLQIIFVNLGKQLIFDLATTIKTSPKAQIKLVSNVDSCKNAKENDFLFLEAENYQLIENLEIDLFINVVSFQEMNLEVIKNYFKHMRNSKASKKYFYCLNRDSKMLPDGQIIRFDEYPWENSVIMKDEIPKWCQNYFINRPPFVIDYDGLHRSRFIRF